MLALFLVQEVAFSSGSQNIAEYAQNKRHDYMYTQPLVLAQGAGIDPAASVRSAPAAPAHGKTKVEASGYSIGEVLAPFPRRRCCFSWGARLGQLNKNGDNAAERHRARPPAGSGGCISNRAAMWETNKKFIESRVASGQT